MVAPKPHFENEKRFVAVEAVDNESEAIKLPNVKPVAVGSGVGSILPLVVDTLSKEYVAVN